jgi:hypothetical protein
MKRENKKHSQEKQCQVPLKPNLQLYKNFDKVFGNLTSYDIPYGTNQFIIYWSQIKIMKRYYLK